MILIYSKAGKFYGCSRRTPVKCQGKLSMEQVYKIEQSQAEQDRKILEAAQAIARLHNV